MAVQGFLDLVFMTYFGETEIVFMTKWWQVP